MLGRGRALGATAVCLLMPLVSQAGVIDMNTNTPAISASPGTTGTFEEYISVPDNLTSDTVTAFSLTLTATAVTGSGLSFTNASMATSPDAYLFQGMSADAQNNIPFSASTFPTLSFTVSDSDTNSAGVTFASLADYGLVEVTYAVAANATPGIYTITPTTMLTETGSIDNLDLPGTFTILPAPEPSTWALLLAGAGLPGALLLRRRLRAA